MSTIDAARYAESAAKEIRLGRLDIAAGLLRGALADVEAAINEPVERPFTDIDHGAIATETINGTEASNALDLSEVAHG